MSEQLPARITVEALALSPAELRAFPRWYTDILLRKRSESVAVGDVLSFLDNFGISFHDKQRIKNMFDHGNIAVLEPPQFYVFLRLTGHLLQGKELRRELAFVAAPVPRPRSILSTRGHKHRTSAGSAKDIDSFMSLMMSGKGVQKRKKKVTFDSRPPQVTEAAHRSMGELLRQSGIQEQLQIIPPPRIPDPEPEPIYKEPEIDQPIANNQFAKVNIDTVLHNGQSMLPQPPAPRKSQGAGDSYIQQLTQQHTQHPTQMSAIPQPPVPRMRAQLTGPGPMQPQLTGPGPSMQPQLTGPLQPQLTAQVTGQFSGIQPQISGVQPQLTGMQSMQPPSLNVQLTGPPMAQPQYTGPIPTQQQQQQQQQLYVQPQLTGPLRPQLFPQPPPSRISNSVSPQVTGTAPVQPGMQFLNSVQQPSLYQISGPPQYVRNPNQAYNMQQLRDQLPNW